MKNQEFKNFLVILLLFVIGVMTIAASAGCISFGVSTKQALYTVVGIFNLGWIYPAVRQAIKYIKNNN